MESFILRVFRENNRTGFIKVGVIITQMIYYLYYYLSTDICICLKTHIYSDSQRRFRTVSLKYVTCHVSHGTTQLPDISSPHICSIHQATINHCQSTHIHIHTQVEQTLRHLFVKRIYLWPRFHMHIASALTTGGNHVIELSQPLSSSMRAIQAAILAAIDACIQELKK